MSAETVGSVILWLIVLAIVVVIAVYLLRWLYRRSTKETAFVRTGLGGEKVVISGGAFVVPVLHEIMPVGMNVMRIEVSRRQIAGADHQGPDARRRRRRLLRSRRLDRASRWAARRRRSAAGRSIPRARASFSRAGSPRRFAPPPRR